MLEKYLCSSLTPCIHKIGKVCSLIPGACEMQLEPKIKSIQECCLCGHRRVCKYREEFEEKKANTYIKLECKYFMN